MWQRDYPRRVGYCKRWQKVIQQRGFQQKKSASASRRRFGKNCVDQLASFAVIPTLSLKSAQTTPGRQELQSKTTLASGEKGNDEADPVEAHLHIVLIAKGLKGLLVKYCI
mmetsp:Transcript_46629/g.74244  ORF Transcript_46629/g.74244 Transcript_46629/m.74244 type:complete len:111 (-) Transcript_46629:142-474(-)